MQDEGMYCNLLLSQYMLNKYCQMIARNQLSYTSPLVKYTKQSVVQMVRYRFEDCL